MLDWSNWTSKLSTQSSDRICFTLFPFLVANSNSCNSFAICCISNLGIFSMVWSINEMRNSRRVWDPVSRCKTPEDCFIKRRMKNSSHSCTGFSLQVTTKSLLDHLNFQNKSDIFLFSTFSYWSWIIHFSLMMHNDDQN